MNVTVTIEYRFAQTPDGAIWTQTGFAHDFWTRYLDVFDQVRIVARAAQSLRPPAGAKRVDGEQVSFAPIPYYLGPIQYARRIPAIAAAVGRAVGPNGRGGAPPALILRVSSPIADAVAGQLIRSGRPFGAEIVADPYDVLAPGANSHPLRPVLRRWLPRQLRRQCARACATAYVTEQALQRRYPPSSGAFSTHYSSVELGDEAFVRVPRTPAFWMGANGRRLTLITVATLAQLYKAPDTLIGAVHDVARSGADLELVLVGDGKHRPELEALASGLGDRVRFLGQLPAGSAVREQLDRADLFVLPSHMEGLPRAMIEAMARGLPCIGSTVGGFPELLPAEDLVPPGDHAALSQKIREVAGDPERMARMSARNLARAAAYHERNLRPRRAAFYRHVREATEAWCKRKL